MAIAAVALQLILLFPVLATSLTASHAESPGLRQRTAAPSGQGSRTLDLAARGKGRAAKPLYEGRIPYGSFVNPPKYLDMIISPVFVDRRPEKGSFLGCFPCKNGMSWWVSFANQVDPHWRGGDASRLWRLPEGPARAAEADATIPRFVITRNPMIRALSGFLTWVDQSNDFNYVPKTFEAFVRRLDESREAYPTSETFTWSKNPHWRPQREYCGLNHGEEFVAHKAEERSAWGSRLFAALHPRYAEVARALNFSKPDQPNGEDVWENCPGYGCHAKAIMGEYYTPELFERVRRFYLDDIVYFKYEREVEALRQELFGGRGHVLALSALPPRTPRELARALDVSSGLVDLAVDATEDGR